MNRRYLNPPSWPYGPPDPMPKKERWRPSRAQLTLWVAGVGLALLVALFGLAVATPQRPAPQQPAPEEVTISPPTMEFVEPGEP